LRRLRLSYVLAAGGLVLAGVCGYFASAAVGGKTAVRTTTINVATGVRGPQGEPGPRGPAGLECPAGYTAGVLVVNHPSGQVSVFTCLKD